MCERAANSAYLNNGEIDGFSILETCTIADDDDFAKKILSNK